MNAALIAACAANASRHKETSVQSPQRIEVYYNVRLRKYYRFSELTIVTPSREYYTGSLCAPVRHLELTPVLLPAKSFVVEQRFPVASSKCPEGIDKYVENNPDKFKESPIWRNSDEDVFALYAAEISKQYNVEVTPGSLAYTAEFYMEVD